MQIASQEIIDKFFKLLIASVSIIDLNLRANESEEVSSVKIKICTEILKYILYILNILISPQNS